ncbi:hypothetical protein BGW37DRAFT_464146 [Umbelopsis sp. PMI_123]|nr:hypothetical protein BGW37DRAFT_464146 [Umbelopsis sp. PMI_123]
MKARRTQIMLADRANDRTAKVERTFVDAISVSHKITLHSSPPRIRTQLIQVYESVTDNFCDKVRYAKRLLKVMPCDEQSLRLQGSRGVPLSTFWSSAISSYFAPTTNAGVELSCYLQRWENLRSTQDFQYLNFILRVREISKEDKNDVEMQLLIALINRPPREDKAFVLYEEYQIGWQSKFLQTQERDKIYSRNNPEKLKAKWYIYREMNGFKKPVYLQSGHTMFSEKPYKGPDTPLEYN